MESNAIVSPSGDQRGVPVTSASMEVSWTALLPSRSASQISNLPERFEAKATRRASGDNCALLSSRVEETEAMGGDGDGAPGAEISTARYSNRRSCEHKLAVPICRAGAVRPPAFRHLRPRKGVAPASVRRERTASKDSLWRKKQFLRRLASTPGKRHSPWRA